MYVGCADCFLRDTRLLDSLVARIRRRRRLCQRERDGTSRTGSLDGGCLSLLWRQRQRRGSLLAAMILPARRGPRGAGRDVGEGG